MKTLYRVFLASNRSLMHGSQKGIKQGIYPVALLYGVYSGMVVRGRLCSKMAGAQAGWA